MDAKLKAALDAAALPTAATNRVPFINGLIYGHPGTQKTVTACRSGLTTLLLSAGDGGEVSLHNHPEFLSTVRVQDVAGFSHLKAVGQAVAEGVEPYSNSNVVVIDNISDISDEYLDALLHKKGGPDRAELSTDEFSKLKSQMRAITPTLSKAPTHVIWIAHETDPSFMAKTDKDLHKPAIPAKTFDNLARSMHFIARASVDSKGQGWLDFSNGSTQIGKSRIDALKGKIKVEDVWPAIHEWAKGITDG